MRRMNRGQFSRIAAVLVEIGFSATEIVEIGNVVINMAAANSGGGVMPVPVGRGEIVHDVRGH
jgi:hypothetical protein